MGIVLVLAGGALLLWGMIIIALKSDAAWCRRKVLRLAPIERRAANAVEFNTGFVLQEL